MYVALCVADERGVTWLLDKYVEKLYNLSRAYFQPAIDTAKKMGFKLTFKTKPNTLLSKRRTVCLKFLPTKKIFYRESTW